jgi:hypothetical protein
MSNLIDYAMPCMKAESALKRLHDAMLNKKYDDALEEALDALVEVKMTYNAVLHAKEQENAVREQAAPVQERVSAAGVSRGA